MVSAMSEKDIQDAFCVIDVDGDGTITLDELRYILTNIKLRTCTFFTSTIYLY